MDPDTKEIFRIWNFRYTKYWAHHQNTELHLSALQNGMIFYGFSFVWYNIDQKKDHSFLRKSNCFVRVPTVSTIPMGGIFSLYFVSHACSIKSSMFDE